MKKFFVLFLLSALMIFNLTGCNKTDENLEMEKVLSEIRFLENRCITILSKIVSGDYELENGEIDWDLLKEEYSVLDRSIPVILVDFASSSISSKNIVSLEKSFSDLNSFLEAKDLNRFSQLLCDNYSFISTTILDSFEVENVVKQEKELKSKFLYVGIELQNLDSEGAFASLNEFQKYYENLSQNSSYLENHSYQINRVFIQVQNLKNFLDKDDFENGKMVFLQILQEL